jgi:hypothetical protein
MERLKDEAVLLALAQKVASKWLAAFSEPLRHSAQQILLCSESDLHFVGLQVSEYLMARRELDKLAAVALNRIQHFYYKTGEVKCVTDHSVTDY